MYNYYVSCFVQNPTLCARACVYLVLAQPHLSILLFACWCKLFVTLLDYTTSKDDDSVGASGIDR